MAELALSEQNKLRDCEAVIDRGLRNFVEVGQALAAILEAKLFRVQHKTFAEYCRVRWDWDTATVYRQIDAYHVHQNVAHGRQKYPILPTKERQIRALTKVAGRDQQAVWAEVVKTAPEVAGAPHITAKHVESVVARHLGETTPKATPTEPTEPATRKSGGPDGLTRLKEAWEAATKKEQEDFWDWLDAKE